MQFDVIEMLNESAAVARFGAARIDNSTSSVLRQRTVLDHPEPYDAGYSVATAEDRSLIVMRQGGSIAAVVVGLCRPDEIDPRDTARRLYGWVTEQVDHGLSLQE